MPFPPGRFRPSGKTHGQPFRQILAQPAVGLVYFLYKVWKSAISGESIPEEEMRAWQQGTVKRIKALGPKRILEIGCGHGLLLFPLLAEVERYAGTELSNEALDWLSQGLAGLPDKEKSKISLRHAEAAAPLGPTDESFDLAIYTTPHKAR